MTKVRVKILDKRSVVALALFPVGPDRNPDVVAPLGDDRQLVLQADLGRCVGQYESDIAAAGMAF